MTNPAVPLEIDVQTLKALQDQGSPLFLLDCREVDEWNVARIAGAVLIPMGEIPGRLAELRSHQQEHVVVHCHHGGRSLQVTRWLRQQGFTNVQNLRGGIDAWSQWVDTSVPRY